MPPKPGVPSTPYSATHRPRPRAGLAQPIIPVGREGSFPIQLQKGRECHTLPQGFPSWQAGDEGPESRIYSPNLDLA